MIMFLRKKCVTVINGALTAGLLWGLQAADSLAHSDTKPTPREIRDVCEFVAKIPKYEVQNYLLRFGYLDINNDGTAETVKQGLTGTMRGDRLEFITPDGSPLLTEPNFEWEPYYWPLGQALIPFGNKATFTPPVRTDLVLKYQFSALYPDSTQQPVPVESIFSYPHSTSDTPLSVCLAGCLPMEYMEPVGPLAAPIVNTLTKIEGRISNSYDYKTRKYVGGVKIDDPQQVKMIMEFLKQINTDMRATITTFPTPTHTIILTDTENKNLVIFFGVNWIGGRNNVEGEASTNRFRGLSDAKRNEFLELLGIRDYNFH